EIFVRAFRFVPFKPLRKSASWQESHTVKPPRVWPYGVGGGYDAVGRRNGAAEIVPCALGQIGAVLHLIGSPGHGAPSKGDDATTRSCHRLNHRRQGASQ